MAICPNQLWSYRIRLEVLLAEENFNLCKSKKKTFHPIFSACCIVVSPCFFLLHSSPILFVVVNVVVVMFFISNTQVKMKERLRQIVRRTSRAHFLEIVNFENFSVNKQNNIYLFKIILY